MPEIGTSGSMSGDGKRSVGHRPQATAPILDSTVAPRACLTLSDNSDDREGVRAQHLTQPYTEADIEGGRLDAVVPCEWRVRSRRGIVTQAARMDDAHG